MERKGIPVVVETWNTPDIIGITQKAALFGGVPEIRQVPTTPDTALTSLKQWLPDIIKGLTTPLTDKEKWAGTYKPEVRPRILMTGTYDEVQAYYEGDLGRFPAGTPPHALMTDGTPVTPPTEEAVARMLKGTSHKPNEVVNPKFLPNEYVATVEKVAINGVMAGCKPEYMPVLLAIAEAGAAVGCQ